MFLNTYDKMNLFEDANQEKIFAIIFASNSASPKKSSLAVEAVVARHGARQPLRAGGETDGCLACQNSPRGRDAAPTQKPQKGDSMEGVIW